MTTRARMAKAVSLLVGGALLLGLVVTGRAQETASLTIKAPDFTLKDLDGKAVRLADFKDKVVLLAFWATWCPPCRAEIPHFKELQEKYGSKGLAVVGISLDQGGAAAVKPFAAANRINYTMLLDSGEAARAYGGVRSIPTTFLIDRKGNIARKFVGYQSKDVFEREIQRLL